MLATLQRHRLFMQRQRSHSQHNVQLPSWSRVCLRDGREGKGREPVSTITCSGCLVLIN